jgi:hypothetical protein
MLRRVFLLVSIVSVAMLGAEAMATPKSDCEDLLNAVLPMAENLLAAHGEFYPFGASMKPGHEISLTTPYDGRERPASQPLIDLLHDGFHQEAMKGTIVASATVYDVRIARPGAASKTDAVAIELDHRDNYSTIVFFPYAVRASKVEFEKPFANKGGFGIFRRDGD